MGILNGHRWVLLAMGFANVVVIGLAGADDVQPSDLVAGYQYNVSLFPRMRVVYEGVVELTNEFYERNPQSTQPKRTAVIEDYWTDRTRFLLRMPRKFTEGQAYPIPAVNITPDLLSSVYKDMFVFSYSVDTANGYRMWSGVDEAGLGSGVVGQGPISDRLGEFVFPPMGIADSSWGDKRIWHAIDVFYANPPGEMRVLGRVHVDGVETVVVESLTRKPAAQVLQAQVEGRLETGRVVTAWIDVGRGCLPLRIVENRVLLLEGQRLGTTAPLNDLERDRKQDASKIVSVSRVQTCEGGGFYPSEGVCVERTISSAYQGPYNDVQGLLSGRVVDIPYVDLTRYHWRVLAVQPNVTVPEQSLALPFPDKTRYFDETRARGMIEGVSEVELDRLLAEEEQLRGHPHGSATRYRFTWFLIAINVLLIVGLVYFFWFRRAT